MQEKELKASPDTADMFGLLITQQKDDYLEVRLPKYFRDQGWANGIGQIQDEICQYATQKLLHPQRVVFDFRLCRWIDPLPLMSILLEIANARQLGMAIDINLPESESLGEGQHSKGPYQESPNRLLLFLKQEGFLNCIDEQNEQILYFPIPNSNFLKMRVKPSYEDARCIPMRLIIVPNNDEQNNGFTQYSRNPP